MHYTGTIWRPPYEADSLILEATAGCTHRACKFCTLYDELPFKFKASELSTIESDLLEAQTWFHDPLSKIEKYQEIKALVKGLEIPVEFAMLGASNPVMLQGRLPEQREQIVATLDRVIEEIGEDKLRCYRTNLKHL